MAKKPHTKPEADKAPKFGGFHALADGLGPLKARMEADAKAKAEAPKGSNKGTKPPQASAPPRKAPERSATRAPASEVHSTEDDLAFHRMMSGVVPLGERASRVPVAATSRVAAASTQPEDVRSRAQKEADEVLEHLHRLVDDAVRFEVVDDGQRVEGRRSDVAPSVVRSLRRGALPIDARLDLHGLSVEEGRARLVEYLRTARSRGERCILVIHGKGQHSPVPGSGVLRGEIAAWLSQGRAREHVAAFATAQDEDGGEGAVYVALRR